MNPLKAWRERRYHQNRIKLLGELEQDVRENTPTAVWETPLATYNRSRMHRLYYRVNLLRIRLLAPEHYDAAYESAARDGHVTKAHIFGRPSMRKHLHASDLYTDYKPFRFRRDMPK